MIKKIFKLPSLPALQALILMLLSQVFFMAAPNAYAATNPGLGNAESFAILSSTYTNTTGGTTINGDLGYTTGPATTPTVNGTTYTDADAKYTQAGIDQGSALTNLNNQPCTHTFDPGAIDLASNVDFPTSTYTPGVYCIDGAASIGGGGTITLSGSGTYIFRMDGALTTSDNSIVVLSGGASACDVWWTPTEATTLGADSTFVGTDIDASGITIGSNVTWTGRALAFGGTVSTDADTISAPTCSSGDSSSGSSTSSSTSTATAPPAQICPPLSYIAPIIIESYRVDADSIFISWGPYSGIDTFIVEYGPTNGDWRYNTAVTGFSTTLNNLPANQPFWVRVAATDNCSIGTYGEAMLVGGPLLPNTGNPPQKSFRQSLTSKISNFSSWLFLLRL